MFYSIVLGAMAYCTGFSALAAIVNLFSTFFSGIHSAVREYIIGIVSFLIFIGWIALDALLSVRPFFLFYSNFIFSESNPC